MGFKKMDKSLSFADFALQNSLKHNRSLKNMVKFSQSIDWNRIITILLSHCTVGTVIKGADAYNNVFKRFYIHITIILWCQIFYNYQNIYFRSDKQG